MASKLQKAQQAWAWRRAQLLGCESTIKHIAFSIPIAKDKVDQLNNLIDHIHNANDAKFRALGGTITKKAGEL